MEIEKVVQQLSDLEATKYSEAIGHGFSSLEEQKAWADEVSRSVPIAAGQTCIDVGAGTGILTHLIASLVAPKGAVIAQDISGESLAINKETLPSAFADSVEYLQGDAHDASLFMPRFAQSADIIAARQSVVLFRDPVAVFELWSRLLKPGGRVVILDALWSRASWTGQWGSLVDALPLSCIQTLGTIPYLLTRVGLEVRETRFLDTVNRLLGDEGSKCPRFVVVAELPKTDLAE